MPEILTESFCERCGTRYTFEASAPRIGRLTKVKIFSKGLRNYVLSDETTLDEALADARSEEDRQASTEQLDAFHKTFNFCMSCRQYTCGNCWNEAEGRCLTCSPHLGHDVLDAPFPMLDSLTGRIEPLVDLSGNGHGVDAVSIAPLEWPTADAADEAADGTPALAEVEELDAERTAARLDALLGHPTAAEAAPDATEPSDAVAPEAQDITPELAVAEAEIAEDEIAEAAEVHAGAPDVEPEPELVEAHESLAQGVAESQDESASAPAAAAAGAAAPGAAAPGAAADGHSEHALTEDELLEIQASLAATPTNGRTPPAHRTVEHGPAEIPAEDVAGRAAAAAAQTADLLARFRPTDGAESEAVNLTEETLSAQEEETFDEPISLSDRLAGEPIDHVEHGPSVPAQPLADTEAPVAAEPGLDRKPSVAEQPDVAAAQPAAAASAAPVAPVLPTPPAAAAEPTPAATEPTPAATVPTPAAPSRPAAEPIAAESAARPMAAQSTAQPIAAGLPGEDRVEQPTWRIVAPDDASPLDGPEAPSATVLQPQPPMPPAPVHTTRGPEWPTNPPAAEPTWPTAPVWPSQQARGTSRGAEAVWAASNRDVLSQPESGVQACVNCGLALSATARFCRRCGTSQVHA